MYEDFNLSNMFNRIYEHHAKKHGTKMLNNILANIGGISHDKNEKNQSPILKKL